MKYTCQIYQVWIKYDQCVQRWLQTDFMTMPNLYPSVGNTKNMEVPWKRVLPNRKANSETYLKEGIKLDTVYYDVKACPKIHQNWPESGNNQLIRGQNTSIYVDFVLGDIKAHAGFPAFLVFLHFPSILNVLLVFPSFVKNLLVFLVFHKFGTFLDKCFEILFQNKIFRVLDWQSLVFFVWSVVTDA